jgi:2-methylcitrate dehydratase PrpD
MGITQQLAAIVCGTRYQDLPAELIERTTQAIADGVAVALAGNDQAPVQIIAQHFRDLGGKPVSSAWGMGFRTSPVYAAYINGVATHVLDFEPMWSPPTHSVSPTVPVAFALAEAYGASGREIVTAVAKGMEIQGRMQYAGDQYEPEHLLFHPPGTAGVMGAVVTAAHLLGLDELQLRNAMGIAASRLGALLANVGTMTKSTHCGGAGAAGLDAALLAKRGFTGNTDVFEAHKGIVVTFFRDSFDEKRLLDYGKPWRVVDPGLAIKLYPSQYGTHFAISAALALREQVGDPSLLASVKLTTPVMKYVDRPSPATGLDGKFSLQYTAAAALLDGAVKIDSFTNERRFRPDMEAMLARMQCVQSEAIPGEWRQMRVEIDAETTDGRSLHVVSHGPKGCWGQPPVTPADHRTKLDDCLGRSMKPAEVDRLIRMIHALPTSTPATVQRLLQIVAAAKPGGGTAKAGAKKTRGGKKAPSKKTAKKAPPATRKKPASAKKPVAKKRARR